MINDEKKLLSKTIIYDNNFTNHHYGTTTSCRQKVSMASINTSSFYSSSQSGEFKSKSCERLNVHARNMAAMSENKHDQQQTAGGQILVNDNSGGDQHELVESNNFDCLSSSKKLSYSKSLKLVSQPQSQASTTTSAGGPIIGVNTVTSKPSLVRINDRSNRIANSNLKKLTETSCEPSWKELAHRKHTAW